MIKHALCLLLALAAGSQAFKVLNVHCISEIQARFAITDFLSTIENTNWGQEEATYEMLLPERAFISSFSIEMDGKVTQGDVREKERARLDYEQARREGKASGHIEETLDNLPKETKRFLMKVNVPSNKRVSFNMTYQELIPREDGVYKHVVNIRPNQPVDDVQVDILVAEKERFRTLSNGQKIYVPQFRQDLGYMTNDRILRETSRDNNIEVRTTEQNGGSLAYIYFNQAFKQPAGQVVVLFDVERRNNQGGTIQTYDGYFLQSIAPDQVQVGPKNVIFVLDKSGSMRGRKISQMKKAMETILSQLNSQDKFNVILFSKETQAWVDILVPADAPNKDQAKRFIDQAEAKGGTNIHDSIKEALQLLDRAPNKNQVLSSMVIFLTDGKATVGVKDTNQIVSQLTDMNTNTGRDRPHHAIHTVGFGNNADMLLLQQLSGPNEGVARRVFADSDADVQLQGVLQQFTSPKLKDVRVNYLNGAVDVGSLVRPDNNGLFNDGGEVVVVGKLSDNAQRQGLQFDSVVTGKSGTGRTAQFKQKGSTKTECYPNPKTAFPRDNVPQPKYMALCDQPSTSSSSSNNNGNRATTTPAPPTTTTDIIAGLGSRFSNIFGSSDLGSRFSSLFGNRGGRGKRQTEGSGDISRPIGAANSIGGFIERTWAYLTIKKNSKEAEEWIRPEAERNAKRQKAIELSLKYGFVSKYTSMIVVHDQLNRNGNDINEDVPSHNNRGLPAADDMPDAAPGERQQAIINKVSPDGRCRGAVLLAIDSQAASELLRQESQIVSLINAIFADKSFTTPSITLMNVDNNMAKLTISPDWSKDKNAVIAGVKALMRGQTCSGCKTGGQAMSVFGPLMTSRKNERLHKSLVLFTDSSKTVPAILKNVMSGLAMPKVLVPSGRAFTDDKRNDLLTMTSDNQILDNINLSDILSLITC